MKLLSLACAAGLVLAASPAAHAQLSPDLIMETYNSNIQVLTSGVINKDMLDKTVARSNARGGSRGTPTTSSTTPAKTAATTSFAYTATPALRQQTVTRYAQRLKPTNAPAAQEVLAVYGPGKADYWAQYRAMLAYTGLRENDVADVLANYLVTGYQIVNNLTGAHDISPAQNRGARAQVVAMLAGNPQLQTAATRAQVGEELKLQTVLLGGGYAAAVHNKTQPAYQQSVRTLFQQQYHLDLAHLTLTAQGFAGK